MTLNEAMLVLERVQGLCILTKEENAALSTVEDFIALRATIEDFDSEPRKDCEEVSVFSIDEEEDDEIDEETLDLFPSD